MVLKSAGTSQWEIALRAGDGLLHIYDLVNNLDRVVVNSSGNVGIGTASPANKLHVNGGLKASSIDTGGVTDCPSGWGCV